MRFILALLATLTAVACTTTLPLTNLPCPCATGWTCCAGQDVCVPAGDECPAPQPDMSPAPAQLTWLVGDYGGPGTRDGIGTEARFAEPTAVVADDNYLYVGDYLLGRGTIRRVTIATGEVTTFAGMIGEPMAWGENLPPPAVDGTGRDARFGKIWSLALDGAGHLFVGDDCLVRKVDVTTAVVTTIVPGALGNWCGYDYVTGLASDGAGSLYATQRNRQIVKFDATTGTRTVLVDARDRIGLMDGTFANAQLNDPTAVLYVSDFFGPRLLVADSGVIRTLYLDREEVFSTTSSGFGTLTGFANLNGDIYAASKAGNLWQVQHGVEQMAVAEAHTFAGIASNAAGHLFAVDATRPLVYSLGTTANPITVNNLAGRRGGAPGSEDGPPAVARFARPTGVVATATAIFVTDENGLRRVDPSAHATTTVFEKPDLLTVAADDQFVYAMSPTQLWRVSQTTFAPEPVAGRSVGSNETLDGVGDAATFRSPSDLTLDGMGHAFITDAGRLRRVDLATRQVTTWLADDAGKFNAVVGGPAGTIFVAFEATFVPNHTVESIDLTTKERAVVLDKAVLPKNGVWRLAYDGAHATLYLGGADSAVRALDLASHELTVRVGVPGVLGALPGPLPATLNQPSALAADAAGGLLITDENSLFRAN